ncbi:MAG: beta-ketoacyl-[acyl-carrier-protein] synthase family protein [Desulfuromonadales bacterium]|nr:beta-ketoacyl-[acyl-carrier-protein] synthase family protein [Desulfuromonadales bacterium]
MIRKRVVITGMGVFCGAGQGVREFSRALLTGTSGIGEIDLFDVSPFPSHIGAQIKGYDPHDHFDRRETRLLSRSDQFGVIAAGEALTDSGVQGVYSPYEMGVSLGAGAAGMYQSEFWLKACLEGRREHPTLLRGVLPDQTGTDISRIYGLAGYQGTVTTACSSSATAIGWGADLVATGQLRAVVAGGADTLSILTYAGFNSLRVVDPEPCAPFSHGRRGISLGEGAAFMVLESEEDALARGARIYGAVLGYALAGEAHHMTAPDPGGIVAARVMSEALERSVIDVSQVGWVNAHGTGTPLNDVVESNAMKLVFGERAVEVPLVSTKGMTGHCLGAAGAIEAVATVVALNEKIIPQTLNFRGRDSECDLEYGHGGSRPTDCRIAMSNSFAFGGNITSLVLSS